MLIRLAHSAMVRLCSSLPKYSAAGGADENDKFLILNVQVKVLNGYGILAVDLFYVC